MVRAEVESALTADYAHRQNESGIGLPGGGSSWWQHDVPELGDPTGLRACRPFPRLVIAGIRPLLVPEADG